MVTKDAMQGSEAGKAISLYVLDAFISIDQEKFFLNQLQSRGILESLQRMSTLEAQLSLLLRISHNYSKHGATILQSMGILEQIGLCRAVSSHIKGISRLAGPSMGKGQSGEVDKQRLLVTPVLRLGSCLTSLVDASDFLEVKNKIVREVMNFVKGHQATFDQILREDISKADGLILERINLVVSILSKVWPYEENDEYGFVQELVSMMSYFFQFDPPSSSSIGSSSSLEDQKKLELLMF